MEDKYTPFTASGPTTGRAKAWRTVVLRSLLLCGLLLCMLHPARATHYRYGSLTWQPVSTTSSSLNVQFKVSQSFRRSFVNFPFLATVGSNLNTGYFLTFGDNTSAPIVLHITAVDVPNDIFYGEVTIAHSYARGRSYTAFFTGTNRISTLLNNADTPWYVSTTVDANFAAVPNSSPVSTLPPVVNLPTGQAAATFTLPANDPDGNPLSFRMATLADLGGNPFTNAPGMSVNPTTGVVTFPTIGKAIGSLYNAIIVVSDGHTSIMVDFLVNITRISVPPTFDYSITPSNGQVFQLQPGQLLTFTVKARDSDPGDHVNLQAIGLPPGAVMGPALPLSGNPVQSTFSWTPTVAMLGTSVINFVGQDDLGAQATTSVTIQVSTRPVFDVPPTPSNGSIFQNTPGTPFNVALQASALDPNDRVSIVSATGLPAAASFGPALPTVAANPTSTTLSWTPTVADWGLHAATFTARNLFNDQTTHSLGFIVNSAPSFTSSPGTPTVLVGQPYSYTITATDPDIPYGDVLALVGSGLPAWLTLVDNGNGTATLSGTPGPGDAGSNPVTLAAEDTYHHGNSYGDVLQTYAINVVLCNLSLARATTNVDCFGKSNGSVDLTVSGGTAPFTFAWTGPGGFTASTEDISGLPAGTYSVLVTDANGCREAIQAGVTEPPLELPQLSCPASISVGNDAGTCGAVVRYTAPVGTHSCRSVSTALTGGLASGAVFPLGTTTVTYTVTDETGGTASCSFSVTVTDTEAPTLSLPANIVLSAPATQCGAAVSFSATATDNCSGATVTAVPASGSTFPVGTTTVLVSAVDATGNTSSGSFLVTVNDVTAPTVLTQNISVTLAGGTASITAAQVENGSTDACGIASRSVSPSAFTCATTGPQTVTLTVTDVHGNTATGTATVTVLGGLATPSITVTKASLPYTGGGSNTLFLGYGPQTATLTASAGGTSYAWSPATGLSNANVANPVFTASVAGSFTYSVLVTNVSGCTATASVTMRVVDARCGSKNEKVLVCHDGHEICISPNAVDTHLTSPSHHDQLGPCGNSARSVASGTGPTELSVFPNPTTERATVSFRTPTAGPAQVRIYNELGQLVSTVFDGLTQAGELRTVTLDSQPLAAGVYLCRLVTNSSTETIRLMVAR